MNVEPLVECQITKKMIPVSDAVPAIAVRPGIVKLIRKKYPFWSSEGYVSRDLIKEFRKEYLENAIESEKGDLSRLDKEVVKSMSDHELLVENINQQFDRKLTRGERMADKVAEFGGSWRFIMIFALVLAAWVVLNAVILVHKPLDPFPFLLLNIMLSCLAAIQAPVIMMSQNRKEAKDRLRAEYDYKVNLKAELEIRTLHEKIDNLTQRQWQRLLEIQQVQMDMMDEMDKAKYEKVLKRLAGLPDDERERKEKEELNHILDKWI